ncbi:MAG: formylglycine-generating enzyme family protein [Gammaproteobacteria bacterium]|nr:formylglycine-generating enzyme family protein [Gammaproteobacteria bacterium]
MEDFILRSDAGSLRVSARTKPAWASAMGRDRYGLWCAFEISSAKGEPVRQCMRWIAPGRFLMGSPQNEPGRYGDEGPCHEVTLSEGFWLFDTPVTQALWEAVTEENPSRFKSPQRPVEQVSWKDAKAFLEKINQRYPALQLSLPTEAQWEYACRAGTDTAVYAGPIEIIGQHNAPVLDTIAWYGGNSGVDFELENGHDISDWREKQYDHQRAGTHPVGQKQPNPWGLYDMLGNVWEWCEDGRRSYNKDAQLNPLGSVEVGASRACRGGSWFDDARYVRAAFRYENDPGYRHGNLGFRCARVQQV